MCAINGITVAGATDRVAKMNSITERRGPEGSTIWSNDKITLGHNLLATMGEVKDRESAQPMHHEDSSIVFNGAIFNWKQLDEWDSEVDTQVLLKGLHTYGIDFLDKCEGMWAFAWCKGDELVLCRDRFGIKPLMYRFTDEGLIFSSSPHALENKPNVLDQFADSMYRSFGYVPGYLTLIKGIYKLVPGEVLTYNFETKKTVKSSIWKKSFSECEWSVEEFLSRLEKSINYSGITGRQRGIFLSGGLDSTSIMHYLDDKNTYTTRYLPCSGPECYSGKTYVQGFPNDDANCAVMLAEDYDLNHIEVQIEEETFMKHIRESVKALEFPTFNKNNPSYLMINKVMRSNGTIITYSGDGGDEMYTGYGVHGRYLKLAKNMDEFAAHWEAVAWKNNKRIQLMVNGNAAGRPKQYCEYMEEWFPTQIFGNDFLNNCLAVEMLTRVSEDFLARNDRYGAYYGMEGRFPLLNNEFYQ